MRSIRATPALIALIALISPALPARPDDGNVDKSAYNLFNPVPDDLLRDFTTDRPTKSSTPITVDAGHFQIESDIFNWTYDRWNPSNASTSNLQLFDPTLKLGLTSRTDLELVLSPMTITHQDALDGSSHSSAFGFGDLVTRLKVNLIGDDGGDLAVALVPYVKAPTANSALGNGRWEGGGYLPLTVQLPDAWSITLQPEIDILENAALDGDHAAYLNLINLTRQISETVTGSIELWNDIDTDKGSTPQYTLDLAGSWALGKNLQLDGGANIGLNKASPDLEIYTGISHRF